MIDPISLGVSLLSIATSVATAWFTLLRRGKVVLSQPMVVYFGPDNYDKRRHLPKVYMKSLLFSSSKRGRVIESMYATLTSGEARQNFSIWVHHEQGRFVRGSGIYVGETGVSSDHHFLTPPENQDFKFKEGSYRLDIFLKLLGDTKGSVAFSHEFQIDAQIASEMAARSVGVYFDWGPDSDKYWPHVDEGPRPSPDAEDFIRALIKNKPSDSI